MNLFRLENVIQPYAWGSRSALAELRGASESDTPEAELWMGAHPLGPSRIAGDTRSLLELIRDDPEGVLGQGVAARFANRLPFLFKVIAAAQPLSLQAHPSLEQAREGFAREERAQVPLDARHRNYKDDNHKPELVCALTPFAALCGFRDAGLCAVLLRELAVEGLHEALGELERATDETGLRRFFEKLYTLPAPDVERAVASALAGVERLGQRLRQGGAGSLPIPQAEARLIALWLPRIAALHPRDAGVIGALLLNLIELAPGQAMYLPAGNLHAYLGGTALEIMASSDNVLRGGLTPKHVDVPELLRVVRFEAHEPAVLEPKRLAGGSARELVYEAPAAEFSLSRLELPPDGAEPATWSGGVGPEILLCLEGSVRVSRAGESLELGRGQSVFCAAATAPYTLVGAGRLARAKCGDASVTRSASPPP